MDGRALVLGGGGVTGVAWETGMLAGLAGAGVDLTGADLVVGTSAGSVVAAQITSGRTLDALYAAQQEVDGAEIAATMRVGNLARYVWLALTSRSAEAYRARLGRASLRARTVPAEARRKVIEARLAGADWPQRRVVITAVDADSGEFVTFDPDSGVSLVDAVGASCAVPLVWPPVAIGDRRYVDGGVRSTANADLASGYARVVVLAPLTGGGGRVPSVARQADELRAAGADVVVVSPDQAAKAAIGRNPLDPARRPGAARAGHAQAAAEVDAVRKVWAGQ